MLTFVFHFRHLEKELRSSYSQSEIDDFNDQPQVKDWSEKTPYEREKAEDNKYEEFQVLENAYRLHTTLYNEVCRRLNILNCLFFPSLWSING